MSLLSMSPMDNFEASVDVFVTVLESGMADAEPVSIGKAAQLCSGLRVMAKGLSQYTRFHRVELQPCHLSSWNNWRGQ